MKQDKRKSLAQKSDKELLFDELIDLKIFYKNQEKLLKQIPKETIGHQNLVKKLQAVKAHIQAIESSISAFGDSFLDVYDSELAVPLSESDIFILRDKVREVHHSLSTLTDFKDFLPL